MEGQRTPHLVGTIPGTASILVIVGLLGLLLPGAISQGQDEPAIARSLGSGLIAKAATSGWTLDGNRVSYRLLAKYVLAETPPHAPAGFSGPWHSFTLEGSRNCRLAFVHWLPNARVLDELKVSVAFWSDRPGAQLCVRVVLPRSRNPSTGEPIRFFLLGPEYTRYGRWEVLCFGDLPRLVARQLFVLRAEFGPDVDSKGAYVDQVRINLYLDNQKSDFTLSSPLVTGFVPAEGVTLPSGAFAGDQTRWSQHPATADGQISESGVERGGESDQGPGPLSKFQPPGPPGRNSLSRSDPVAENSSIARDLAPEGVRPAGFGELDGAPSATGSLVTTPAPQAAIYAPGVGGETPPKEVRGGSAEAQITGSPPAAGNHGPRVPFQSGGGDPSPIGMASPPPAANTLVNARSGGNAWLNQAPRLVGASILAGFQPIFPRLVTWQGESLLTLKQLGINGVWATQPVSPVIFTEAKRVGLWVVAPPPSRDAGTVPKTGSISLPPQEGGDRLLGWNLGHQLGRAEISQVRQIAEDLRMLPFRPDAPLVAHVLEGTRELSRLCDVVVFERPLWEEGISLGEWAIWLRLRSELARPGTPFWCGIPVHLPPWVREQLELMGLGVEAAYEPGWTRLRAAGLTALAAGARGLVFTTAQPVDGSDPASQYRRTALQLIQVELEMVEPFLAGGSLVSGDVKSPGGFRAALYRTERARLVLLVPEEASPGGEFTFAGKTTELTFTIPGVPEAYRAYLLLPGAVRPLRHRRTAGGIQVTVDRYVLGSHILLTNEPTVLAAMTERAVQAGPTAASLLKRLASEELARQRVPGGETSFRPAGRFGISPDVNERVRAWLRQSDDRFRLGDYAEAWLAAEQAMQLLLNRLQGSDGATRALARVIVSHPLRWILPGEPGNFSSTPVGFNPGGKGAELLPGGDFEDLGLVVQLGWRHYLNPSEPAAGQVLQSAQAAYRGQAGLELRAEAPAGSLPQPLLESPPLWILSPPLSPPAEGWVVIGAWVNIPEEIQGSVDGLIVGDSFGGLPMAVRLRKTKGWQRVELYRRVPGNRSLEILVALTGYGRAFVDEVSVQWVPNVPSLSPTSGLLPGPVR